MKIVTKAEPISLDEVRSMAARGFGDLVNGVVDIERETLFLDAELKADQEIEFDSMINLRPSSGNRTRGFEDPATRDRIVAIVRSLVRR